MSSTAGGRTRVVILGAGPSGLSAAWELSRPERRGKYDVTLYQVGWQAGGLCSTGRVMPEYWINQNGTHYLFGSYDGTLGLLREAYEELRAQGDQRFGTFDEQLIPRNMVVLEHFFRGAWTQWAIDFPTNGLVPGKDQGSIPLDQWMLMLVEWAVEFLLGERMLALMQKWRIFPDPVDPTLLQRLCRSLCCHSRCKEKPDLSHSHVARAAQPPPTFAGLNATLRSTAVLHRHLQSKSVFSDLECNLLEGLLKGIRFLLTLFLRPLAEVDLEACRAYMMLDLALTVCIGLLSARVFDAKQAQKLDGEDFRAWLSRNGANELTVYSPLVKVWYDAIASYKGGDPNNPDVATGATLVSLVQMVTSYKGSVAYQLAWEAGDSIIGPIFQALKYRGVRFAFFHRVWDLEPEGDVVRRVVLERQAELLSGDPFSYDPFISDPPQFHGCREEAPKDQGRPVWPDKPNASQLVGPMPPEKLTYDNFWMPRKGPEVVLEAGRDFDVLIGALGGAVYKYYGKQLVKAPGAWGERWRAILANHASQETQSLRLWFKPKLWELGWTWGPPITSAFAQPYATWEDPTPCLQSEHWPKDNNPQTLSHLFGPLPMPQQWPAPEDTEKGLEYLESQDRRARRDAQAWMDYATGFLWPRACSKVNPMELDRSYLAKHQIRANAGPVQAYTALYAGSLRYRFEPGRVGFQNFLVCGDWTLTSFPVGSVEGAVLSGKAVAALL